MGSTALDLEATARPVHPRRWAALAVVLVAAFMDLIDGTIVNVAIPSIQRDLDADYGEAQWVAAAYALSFTVGLVTGGRLGDIVGRRRVLVVGMLVFLGASTACGLAPTPALLIAARLAQGLAAALMVPQVLAMIHALFAPAERPRAYGLYGAVLGLAGVGGPILGGVLIEADVAGLGWRSIFLINLPIGLAALVAALLLVPETRAEHAPGLDPVGVALISIALFLLVFPLVQGRELGWPRWSIALVALAAPTLLLFGIHEGRRGRRGRPGLLDPRLLRSRSFAAGLGVTLLVFAGVGAFFFVFTLQLQLGLGFSALRTGLTAVGFPLGLAVASGASTQLAPRLGRVVLLVGVALFAAGLFLLAATLRREGLDVRSWQIALPLAVYGLGMGAVAPSLVDFVLAGVDRRSAGSASGVVNTAIQVGTALGIALVGVVFLDLLGTRAGPAVDAVRPRLERTLLAAGLPEPSVGTTLDAFRLCAVARAQQRDPSGVPVACRRPAPSDPRVTSALAAAGAEVRARDFTVSTERVLWGEGALLLLGVPLVLLMPRRPAAVVER